MAKISQFLILVFVPLLVFSKDKEFKSKTNEIMRVGSGEKKDGSIDLSSEIEQSKSEGRGIGTVLDPESKGDGKKKKKPKRILRVESGPTQTIQVPDNMDWDHNKANHDQQIKKLRKEIDGSVSEDP